MAEKKPIYEEALLDLKRIQEALNANTKEILRSVAKEEIDGVVKESLNESDYEEEAVDGEGDDSETPESPEVDGASSDDAGEAESSEAGAEDEPESIGGDDDTQIPPPAEVGADDQEAGMDADAFGGDELDMTGASDDDVIAIYKKLSGDDEIEIIGDEIHLKISEPGEYIVKKGGLGGPAGGEDEFGGEDELGSEIGAEDSAEIGSEIGTEDGAEIGAEDGSEIGAEDGAEDGAEEGDEEGDEEGVTYEIDMADDDQEDKPIHEDKKGAINDKFKPFKKGKAKDEIEESEEDVESIAETKEEDDDVVEEKIAVGTNAASGNRDIYQSTNAPHLKKSSHDAVKKESITSKKSVVSEAEVKYKKLLTEATQLKNENEEFRQALKKFRSMLVETVVFNSNLSYVTKLFMEHSTTKDEKKKIILRFDEEVTNLKDSKKLYKTIASELGTRKPINEAVENKIIREVTSSTSKQLNEATAYVDPSTQRIIDLIKRVENKDKY